MKIAEINADQLDQYLTRGFFEFDPKTGKDIMPDAPETDEDETAEDGINIDDYTVKDLKAYLADHNIDFDKKAKKDELFGKAVANGLWAGSADDIDDADLSALDEDEQEDDVDADLSSLDDVDGDDDSEE